VTKSPTIPTIRPITFPFVSFSFSIKAEKREMKRGLELKIIAVKLAEDSCKPICVTAILQNTKRKPMSRFCKWSFALK